jgi:hypothetical protein
MKKLILYKNNRIDGKYEVELKDLINIFLESEHAKDDYPFERRFLNFMWHKFPNCSFDPLTSEDWNCIYYEYKNQKK